MMKKESILKTMVSYWSDEDECFVAESSLFPRITGIGDTEEEAIDQFKSSLEDIHADYISAGKVAGCDKRGRPAKGGLDVHVQVRPKTKERIDRIASEFDIAKGEVVDYLVSYYSAAKNVKPYPASVRVSESLPAMFSSLPFSASITVNTFIGKGVFVWQQPEGEYTRVVEPDDLVSPPGSSSGQIIPFPRVGMKRATL